MDHLHIDKYQYTKYDYIYIDRLVIMGRHEAAILWYKFWNVGWLSPGMLFAAL